MMSNNKILTVSYGTFSCTLEGFEDSFDTMKAIAEYFRDLAQEDRYFGAEPPKPDAEMLARIAEREIDRRVEAKANVDGIHLRASTATTAAIAASMVEDDAPAPQEQAPAADPAPAEVALQGAEVALQDDVQDAVPDEAAEAAISSVLDAPLVDGAHDSSASYDTASDVDAADDVNDASVEADEDAVAFEDTQTEDAVVEEDVAEEVETPVEAEAVEAERVEDDIEADVADATDDSDDETDSMILNALSDSAAVEEDATVDEDVIIEDEADDETAEADFEAEVVKPVSAAVAATSIAAKLQRIRAVVAKNRATSDGYLEDEHAEEFEVLDEPEVDFASIESALADDQQVDEFDMVGAQPTESFEDDYEDEDDIEIAVEEDTSEDELSALISQLGDDATDAQDDDVEASVLEETADVVAEDDLSDLDDDEAPVFDEADFADLSDDDDGFDDEDALIAATLETEDDVAEARGRVVSVKREDLEAALESGALDDYEDNGDDAFEDESSLTAEDEDDLMRALADVEAELPDNIMAEADDEDDEDLQGTNLLDDTPTGEEAELDRLMAEADSQMEEPESSNRRNAFSHLRAAVAATKADDKLTEEANSEEDDGAYRTDLAAAVKPRRPAVADGDAAGERTQTARPAPLKLVAEQRIDESLKADGPVAPRRVAAESPLGSTGPAGGFADYAESQGVTELSDLLEAAASYLSFVEGRDQFSRPQLMTKVRQVGPEGFTREDGLRSFGLLLRSGKIAKIKGGRFTVSEDIGFQPDQRAAG